MVTSLIAAAPTCSDLHRAVAWQVLESATPSDQLKPLPKPLMEARILVTRIRTVGSGTLSVLGLCTGLRTSFCAKRISWVLSE